MEPFTNPTSSDKQVENESQPIVELAVVEQVLAGGGKMGALMRSIDWSKTPLGPVSQWPQSLRTALSICLASRFPMLIWWGSELIQFYNDAYRPVLGATKHPRSMGQKGPECWVEIWPVIGPMAESVLETGQATWSDDFLLIMDRNQYIEETYFTFSYSPIRDESGGIGGILVTCTETTERVLGERRLRTLRDLGAQTGIGKTAEEAGRLAIETLAHNPADMPFALLYLLEAEGEQARLLGTARVEPDTSISPPLIDLAGSDNAASGWPLAQAAQTGQTIVIDNLPARFEALPPGPWPEPPHTALVLPIASSGQAYPAGFLIAGVSARRALDDDYRGFFELAASQIATAIANARAYEEERKRAQALAELDRAKTVFFSNVSHEFRTPLTLLLGPLEDALAGELGPLLPQQREALEISQRNSLRLLKLVNTLLDFSRLEANRVEASFQPTDLATFTAELASIFRSAIEQAGLRLVVDCPLLPEPIYVDREMWEKIVLNLLSNAFKFTDEGEIVVTLRALPGHVELAVADTGMGIPADELSHIFERFYRVRNNQARTHEGTGIGLSLVQELARLHGGRVEVVSEVGRGTTFTVHIPRGKSHLPAEQIETQPTLTSTALGAIPYLEEALRWLPDGKDEDRRMRDENEDVAFSSSFIPHPSSLTSARILLAEDNADMRDYLRRLLAAHWTVEAMADGAAALAAALEQPPDLILADVMMPGLDGFALLQELRADPRTQAIPIILLSARAGQEAIIEGLAAGADDYLIKPFNARELLARVEVHLKMAQLRREATEQERALRHEAEQRAAERQVAFKQLEAEQRLSQALYAETEQVKERLERILAGIKDDFVMYDADWRYVYVNDKAAQTLGYPKERLIGQRIWDLFPDAVGNLFYQKVHQAVAEGQEIAFEHYFAPFDRWFENRAYPVSEGLLLFTTDITARKRLEAEREQLLAQLEAEYERTATILQQMPAGVIIAAAPSGKILLVNEQAQHLTGYNFESSIEIEQYNETQNFQGFHPDGRLFQPEEWPLARTILNGEVILNEEVELLGHDGSRIIIQANATPIYNAAGEIVAGVVAFIDVTTQKQAEQTLRESEGRLRLLAELGELTRSFSEPEEILKAITQAIGEHLQVRRCLFDEVDIDQDREIIRSDYCRGVSSVVGEHKLSDYSPETMADMLAGRTVVNYDAQNDPRTAALYETTYQLQGERAYVAVPLLRDRRWVSTLWVSHDQPRHWSAAEVALLETVAGRTWLAVENARLFKEAREGEARFRALANAIPSMVWTAAPDGTITYANERWFNFVGITPEENARSWPELVLHPDDYERCVQAWAQALETGSDEYHIEVRNRRHDGQYRWFLTRAVPTRDAEGRVTAWYGVTTDIHDRKQAEEAEQQARKAADQITQRIISLQAVTAKLSKALTPAEIIQIVFNDGLATIGATGSVVALLTRERDELEIVNSIGYPIEDIASWQSFPFKAGIPMADVIQSRQPLFVSTRAAAAALYPDIMAARKSNQEAWAVLPLLGEAGAIGTISIGFAQAHNFSLEEREFIETLARLCAHALERARLYQQAQQLNAELEQRVLQRTAQLEATNKILKDEMIERQRSHARFITIFHNSPIPISVTTWAEGRFLDVNDSFLDWLGYSRQEIINRTSREVGFQANVEARSQILARLQDQGALRDLDLSYYTKSRQVRRAIVFTERILLEGEACILTVYHDVTEREQMAAELAEVQHRLVESLEQERIHLAQELHDGPVQDLYGVSYGLTGLKEALPDEASRKQLATAQAGIQQAIQTLRATFTDLRPPALAPYGLEKAILSHAEGFQGRYPELKLTLNLTPDGQELPESIRMALFRIYQEALNNIARHAQAQQVWITFTLDAAQAVLEVRDDGQGFEAPQRWIELARQGHLGLIGISERVEALGGRLQIISARGAGALIRVSVPRPA
jgi:PAS domain S-box-containing protein